MFIKWILTARISWKSGKWSWQRTKVAFAIAHPAGCGLILGISNNFFLMMFQCTQHVEGTVYKAKCSLGNGILALHKRTLALV